MQAQLQNQRSEAAWRQAEAARAAAQEQGAGKVYYANDATGERHGYRINPNGSHEDLGASPLGDRYSKFDSDQGTMILDTRTGHVDQAKLTGEPIQEQESPMISGTTDKEPVPPTLPLGPPVKQQPEHVLSQGSELVDSGGKVVAKGEPKPVKPTKPLSSDKKTAVQGKAESYADATLSAFHGDIDKADEFVNNSKSMDPAMKAQVRKLIRDAGKKQPIPKRRFNFTPGNTSQQQQLTTPGPGS
jgi:hypothetical protein